MAERKNKMGNRVIKAALFDLDGVIVDTAKYHYLAWKCIADELGFVFTKEHNERLKGVSRRRSCEILLEVGNITASDTEIEDMMARKNDIYLEYIKKMDASELLDGAVECLDTLRKNGILIALGSASKNAPLILTNLKITDKFDAIIDGNHTTKVKPDPEVFELGAKALNVPCENCVVFEDSFAGIEAAKAAGMAAVGIGKPDVLHEADAVIDGLHQFDMDLLKKLS